MASLEAKKVQGSRLGEKSVDEADEKAIQESVEKVVEESVDRRRLSKSQI